MRVAIALLVLVASEAGATPVLTFTPPLNTQLPFGHVLFDVPSAPQQIRVRNDGDTVAIVREVSLSSPYELVSTSGSLGPGEEEVFSLACHPTDPAPAGGFFDLYWCGDAQCEDDHMDTVFLSCTPGLLDAPVAVFLQNAYAYEPSHQVVTFTNPGPQTVTVTSAGSGLAAFSATVVPATLMPGQSVDVDVAFDTTGPDATGFVDVLSGTGVVARVLAYGSTLKQIEPTGWNLNSVPLGATYTVPLRVRNSFPSARTIVAITSDRADYVPSGLVGTTLQPGEFARGMLTVTATTLGASQLGHVTVVFDTGPGDEARFAEDVVPARFATTAGDATPTDGRLDFGVGPPGATPVERTITISNLDSVPHAIDTCIETRAPFERVGPCPASIPANGSVDLTIRYTPTEAGDFLDGTGAAVQGLGFIVVTLSARADVPLAYSTTALAFGDVLAGDTAEQMLTIENPGTTSRAIAVAVHGDGFATAATSVAIPAHGSATIPVTFAPTIAGDFTGTLELGSDDLDHAVVTLAGTGVAPDEPPPPHNGGGGCAAGGSGSIGLALTLLGLRRRVRRPACACSTTGCPAARGTSRPCGGRYRCRPS